MNRALPASLSTLTAPHVYLVSKCPGIRSNLAEEKTAVEVEGGGKRQILEERK